MTHIFEHCGEKMGVVDTRHTSEMTRRRRKCSVCGHSFITYETLFQEQPDKVKDKVVIKISKREVARIERERRRQAELEVIKTLRSQNKTWGEISQATGKSSDNLRRLADRAGLPKHRIAPKPRPSKLPEIKELIQLYQTKTAKEIGDFYGVSPMAVYHKLHKAGIITRRTRPRRNYHRESKASQARISDD